MNNNHNELIDLITHIEHELDFVEEEISKKKSNQKLKIY
jgi:tRNA U34 5-carboxymethylaminomethyl modifying GTPase MnmE/TrmE